MKNEKGILNQTNTKLSPLEILPYANRFKIVLTNDRIRKKDKNNLN